jgi:hypothetical protein
MTLNRALKWLIRKEIIVDILTIERQLIDYI